VLCLEIVSPTGLQNQDGACSVQDQQSDAASSSSVTDEQTESVFEQLFTAVVTSTDDDRVLCQPFKVLPCRTVCTAIGDVK